LLRDPDGTTRWLDDPCDPPLGVATEFRRREADIPSGSMLVLFTDGLVERRTEPIDAGMDRLRRACQTGPDDPDALCRTLIDAMFRDRLVTDDVAIVVVAVT
jgi:serine phosphatase RsbU (regulator of sigma subunit)